MEERIGSQSQQLYTTRSSSLNGISRNSFEWHLNDWNWDGELFLASPMNVTPAMCRNKQVLLDAVDELPSNSSSSCSEDVDFGLLDREKGDAEKRRRTLAVEENDPFDNSRSLSLNLGGNPYPVNEADLASWAGKNGKGKSGSGSSNGPTCQVEGCCADLTNSKDYHRRHKVCEAHAKSTTAMVGNAIQRFCQQCSRFHLLQEFDEGKRSCRRRLAGHNRRRRKTQTGAPITGNCIDEQAQASSYILITLLRILSNLQSDNSDLLKDQELLTHFLKSITSLASSLDPANLTQLIKQSQGPADVVSTAQTSLQVANAFVTNGVHVKESARPSNSKATHCHISDTQGDLQPTDHSVSVATRNTDVTLKGTADSSDSEKEIVGMRDFDLNSMYIDTEDSVEGTENLTNPASVVNHSPNPPSFLPQGSHQLCPPQMSRENSRSSQYLSSSDGDAMFRTDRIVFKLFGKDPSDFPVLMRSQILDWLSHSPTDIESYIRPGCVILTIYLRLPETTWKELCYDMKFKMNQLLHNSTDELWRRGWIYTRVQNQIAFMYNGQFLLDTPLLLSSSDHHKILCVTPIAVPYSSTSTFTVKGFNLTGSSLRLLCLFEGRYLVQETTHAIAGTEHDPECLTFSCSLPCATGRGFIEVENYGLGYTFFPFIVAEEDVCSEVRMLENVIDGFTCNMQFREGTDADFRRNEAVEFIHEFGWLLRRDYVRSKSGTNHLYSLARFKLLISFAMNKEWPAVLKKLLDILFDGAIDLVEHSALKFALSEGLLHSAVGRNSRTMVEFLLRYMPSISPKVKPPAGFLFTPDMFGPSDITPLHIAASSIGSERVLDALTDDPGQLGIKSWRSSRDSAGFTPEDYARARGHTNYISLVQKKIDKQHGEGQVVLNIAGDASSKVTDLITSIKLTTFGISKGKPRMDRPMDCKWCGQKQLAYHQNSAARTLLYRPAMLTMVGIAAVCVCVGLLLKTPPQVSCVFPSFRWELLEFGYM